MIKYVSNKGGGEAVRFDKAILDGFASDGGLYVPEMLPKLSMQTLKDWKNLSFKDLSFEILSLFIDRDLVSSNELKKIINTAYGTFQKEQAVHIQKLKSRKETYILELFHGPTLSFKDIGQSLLVTLFDFFLKRLDKSCSIIVATTGDTGPAAASFVPGKSSLDAWLLYPKGLISDEQERQMTTLPYNNIHPFGVYNCPNGGDDLDEVIGKLYSNKIFKEKVNLSSINSINWGRIMAQTVHYFYAYFQLADSVGEKIDMAVPSGGFGNLCAGGFARKMGLPLNTLVIANNKNDSLNRVFTRGLISKHEIYETVSSAIDIIIPYNFWRYLYFCNGQNADEIKKWSDEYENNGFFQFNKSTFELYKKGFLSSSVSDDQTIKLIKETYKKDNYVLDPHGAVSLAAVDLLKDKLSNNKMICFATAHPAKFSKVIKSALSVKELPKAATHPSIEKAKKMPQKGYTCDCKYLEKSLLSVMESNWDQKQKVI